MDDECQRPAVYQLGIKYSLGILKLSMGVIHAWKK